MFNKWYDSITITKEVNQLRLSFDCLHRKDPWLFYKNLSPCITFNNWFFFKQDQIWTFLLINVCIPLTSFKRILKYLVHLVTSDIRYLQWIMRNFWGYIVCLFVCVCLLYRSKLLAQCTLEIRNVQTDIKLTNKF